MYGMHVVISWGVAGYQTCKVPVHASRGHAVHGGVQASSEWMEQPLRRRSAAGCSVALNIRALGGLVFPIRRFGFARAAIGRKQR